MKCKPKACFFDLDGTLLNSLADIADAVNASLAAFNLPTHTLDAYRYFVGGGVRRLFASVVPDGLPQETLAALGADMKRRFLSGAANKTEPYEGISDLLLALRQMDLPLAILSNKEDALVKELVKHFFPDVEFVDVRGQGAVFPLKPDPAAALDMAAQLELSPCDIIFIGDTRTDMETAVNAGMIPAGVTWGFRTKEELLKYGAKIVIDRPQELLDHIR